MNGYQAPQSSTDEGSSSRPDSNVQSSVVDVHQDDSNFMCSEYREITYTPGSLLSIPPRDSASHVCYVAKIINTYGYDHALTDNPNTDQEVMTLDHDANTGNHHPYVVAALKVRVKLGGQRAVKLVGAKDEVSPMKVDNFFLIGIAKATDIENPAYYHAYGTWDSVVAKASQSEVDGIDFKGNGTNYVRIPTQPFGDNSKIRMGPLQLEGTVMTNQEFTYDIRALDCGREGFVSDIYMLFR